MHLLPLARNTNGPPVLEADGSALGLKYDAGAQLPSRKSDLSQQIRVVPTQ